MRAVVTGVNRGIGLELVRQLLERGDAVEAAVRRPDEARELTKLGARASARMRIHRCDVGDDLSVRAFAAAIGDAPVDLLVNNAGVMGKMQSLSELDLEDVMTTFSINALGPIRVTRALLPMIRKSGTRKVAHITSKMGAIGDNTSGGAYAYRMSKTALNMASKSMSIDLRKDRVISVVLNPGWVQTDMGGSGATTPVSDSARGMLTVIDRLTLDQSGGFFDFRGERLEW